MLEAEPDGAPNYVTIVEAGLLAKTLLNAAGIGIAINTLITSRDGFADGVPFHILIHQLSSSLHIFDAIETLAKLPRAASGNYMIGAPGGAIANVETAPGGPRDLSVLTGDSGVIVHTNHFVAPIAEGHDLAPVVMSDSYVRYARMDSMFIDNHAPASFEMIAERLADHTDAPGSICCHPDPRSPQPEQWSTLASVIMDVENRTLSLSEGRACDAPRNIHDYSDFLSTTDLTNAI